MIDQRRDRLLGVELVFVDRDLRRLGVEIDQHFFRARLLGKDFFHLLAAAFGHIISGTLNSTVGAPAVLNETGVVDSDTSPVCWLDCEQPTPGSTQPRIR